jgi:hypothetical protein
LIGASAERTPFTVVLRLKKLVAAARAEFIEVRAGGIPFLMAVE